MDKYREAEKVGRQRVWNLISGHCAECYFTSQKANVDLFITGTTGVEVVGEIKYRSGYTMNEIENIGGQMLEKKKYDALMEYEDYMPLYFVLFKDYLVVWDMRKVDKDNFVEETKYHKSTVEDSPTITKQVQYLSITDAVTTMKVDEQVIRDNSETTYS